tara:strand:+ start:268 stop:672 length:405 start_codon:yes stop_codon:yes gene_type:complete
MRSATTTTLLASLALLVQPGPMPGPDRPADRSTWSETDWSAHLADQMGGVAEFRTPDGSRVDILTDEVAWEVDWCRSGKWAEGVGQALFYGLATNRQPGLILLQKDPQAERKFYLRALAVCGRYGITLRVVVAR